MVLIPKGGGYYRVIDLVEEIWGEVAVVLNFPFTASISYNKSLHGFWSGRSTWTATLKIKLLRRIAALREEFLHAIFLDLHKAYDALGSYRCLHILEGYCVGPRSLRLLRRYCERLKMVVREGGYYGAPFCGYIQGTQGDALSPTIFNVVVDAVVCHC